MRFDNPQVFGAKCSICPFQGRRPVSPIVASEDRPFRAKFVILTDYPTNSDSVEGTLLTGSDGALFKRLLAGKGESITNAYVTAAMLCQSKQSDTAKDRKDALICCRPRLRYELESIVRVKQRPTKILALGKYALMTLTGKDKLFSWMGPTTTDGITIQYPESDEFGGKIPKKLKVDPLVRCWFTYLCTFHPKFILINRHYGPVLKIHIERFIGWYNGTVKAWEWKEELWEPNKHMLEALQYYDAHPNEVIASDTETDGLHDPLTQWHKKTKHQLQLLNIGFANADIGVSVPWIIVRNSKDTIHRRIKETTRNILLRHPNRVYQNFPYDYPVEYELALERNFPEWPLADILHMHKLIVPEYNHKLGFQACVDFNAPRWKETFRMGDDMGGKRYAKASLQDRGVYNIRDCYLTYLLYFAHTRRLQNDVHNGVQIYNDIMYLHKIAMGMRIRGFATDRNTRLQILSDLKSQLRQNNEIIYSTIRKLGLNPYAMKLNHASGLIPLFIDKLKVEPLGYTPSGKPKFDINVLLLIAKGKNKIAAYLARHLILSRKLEKVISTYQYLPTKLEFISEGNNTVRPVEVTKPAWNPSAAKTGRWGANRPAIMTVSEGKKLVLPDISIELPNMRQIFVGHYLETPYTLEIEE